MPDYIDDAIDTLDAAIYTGDLLQNAENRETLRTFIDKWKREMDRIEAIDAIL